MVRLARRRCGDRIDARVHDLRSPLDWLNDERFDAAVMALVIHYLDDRVSALREIHRVLRPGGRLIVSTHHPISDWRIFGGGYFDVERVEDDWHRGQGHVRFWRQPLTESSLPNSRTPGSSSSGSWSRCRWPRWRTGIPRTTRS